MDMRTGYNYELLYSEKVTLLGRNIVRTTHGPLYFVLDEGQKSSYHLSVGNRQAIENAIELLNTS